jgi:hypothetical protein
MRCGLCCLLLTSRGRNCVGLGHSPPDSNMQAAPRYICKGRSSGQAGTALRCPAAIPACLWPCCIVAIMCWLRTLSCLLCHGCLLVQCWSCKLVLGSCLSATLLILGRYGRAGSGFSCWGPVSVCVPVSCLCCRQLSRQACTVLPFWALWVLLASRPYHDGPSNPVTRVGDALLLPRVVGLSAPATEGVHQLLNGASRAGWLLPTDWLHCWQRLCRLHVLSLCALRRPALLSALPCCCSWRCVGTVLLPGIQGSRDMSFGLSQGACLRPSHAVCASAPRKDCALHCGCCKCSPALLTLRYRCLPCQQPVVAVLRHMQLEAFDVQLASGCFACCGAVHCWWMVLVPCSVACQMMAAHLPGPLLSPRASSSLPVQQSAP